MGANNAKPSDSSVSEECVDTLFLAVKSGNVDDLKQFQSSNNLHRLSDLRFEGTSLLHYAVRYLQVKCVKFLLETKSFYADLKDKEGNTPLVEILHQRNPDITIIEEILKLLLLHKADINARTYVNRTILLKSLVSFKFDIASLLLKYGANPDLEDHDGLRPIHICASYAELELLDQVITCGADIDGQDHTGKTALYCSVVRGHEEMFNFLLRKRCNPSIGAEHFLPLQTAVLKNNLKFVESLLKHGVQLKVNIKERFPSPYSKMRDYLNLALLSFYNQYENFRLQDSVKQTKTLENFISALEILDLITQATCVNNNFAKNLFFRSSWLPLNLPIILPYNHTLRRLVARLALMHEMTFKAKLDTLLPVVDSGVNKFSLKTITIFRIRDLVCSSSNMIHAVEKFDLPADLKQALLLKDL